MKEMKPNQKCVMSLHSGLKHGTALCKAI